MPTKPTCPHCGSANMEPILPYPLRTSYGWVHACHDWGYVTQIGYASEAEAAQGFAVWCAAQRYKLEEEVQYV